MKLILFSSFMILASVFFVDAQVPVQDDKTNRAADTSSTINTPTTILAQNGYVRPDSNTRFKRYVKSMFWPTVLGKSAVSAGFATWRNSPEEWGDGWEGFGRRFASSTGKNVIKNSAMYALDETFKLDSQYYRGKKKDFGSKLKNAFISPVTARTKEGKRVFGFPRVVGTYTSSIVAAEVWYPSRYDYKNGLKNGTVSLGMNAAFNIVKEFIWKK